MRSSHAPIRSPRRLDASSRWRADAGFTLVELLVVMMILLILTGLVLAAFQKDDTDRLSASGRRLQAYLEGARSQAIKEGKNRGVRLIRGSNDAWVATSLAYIGATDYLTGTLNIYYDSTTSTWVIANNTPGEWWRLAPTAINPAGRDLLRIGQSIEIPAGTGNWYVISPVGFGAAEINVPNNHLRLIGTYNPSIWNTALSTPGYGPQPDPDNDGIAVGIPYRLELAATLLPNKEPVQFDRGIAIDVAASQIPAAWYPAPIGAGANMDILFDPRGNPVGDVATSGVISLYLTTLQDVELTRNLFLNHPANGTGSPNLPPLVPTNAPNVPKVDPRAVSVFAQTGQVIVSPVDLTEVDGNPGADAPYGYARRGREAK